MVLMLEVQDVFHWVYASTLKDLMITVYLLAVVVSLTYLKDLMVVICVSSAGIPDLSQRFDGRYMC